MKITVLIFGLLAILLNDFVIGDPIKQNNKEINKNTGSVEAEVIIGGKNPKRDSSDQTAVEDKTGQSQNYQQPQVQYQSFVPVGGQYYASAATQQVHYAKPQGGVEYAKPEGGIQYASSTPKPAAYQTISYSAHHNGAQQQQQQPQQNNGKLISQIPPAVQYNHAPVQYYAVPQQHQHQHQLQYAIAVPSAGNGHHQQIAFAALPHHGYHGQPSAQIAYLIHPHHIPQHYRGESGGHYATAVPATQQHHPHQLQQFAIIAPTAHHHSQIGYAKLPSAATQQAVIYAAHPGQNYYASQPANLGYYQHPGQAVYQHHHQPYALAFQPSAIQYSPKPIQSTSIPIAVTPAPAQSAHYKNYITTAAASNSNHHNNGATSFATYSAQLPVNQNYGSGGQLQVIKAPVTYATTTAPIATYQHNGGSAGKIYYAAIPAQYQDPGQIGYTQHHGAIHYGQHLYHPSNSKAVLAPTQSSIGQKYQK